MSARKDFLDLNRIFGYFNSRFLAAVLIVSGNFCGVFCVYQVPITCDLLGKVSLETVFPFKFNFFVLGIAWLHGESHCIRVGFSI